MHRAQVVDDLRQAELLGGGRLGAPVAAIVPADQPVVASQLRLLDDALALEGERSLLEALPLLMRNAVDPRLVVGLRERAARSASVATLVELLALHLELDGQPNAIPCERERLVAGWLAFRPEGAEQDYASESARRELLIGIASEGDRELGELLMQAAYELERHGQAEDSADRAEIAAAMLFPLHPAGAERCFGGWRPAASFLAECGAYALDSSRAVAAALSLDPELAAEVWGVVAQRASSWDPAELRPWLDPSRPTDLRMRVASTVADAFALGDRASEEALLPLLDDPDPGLRAASFRWLARGPEIERRLAALFDAWSAEPIDARLERLGELPRQAPPRPFREALLGLGASETNRTTSVIELLGSFQGDEEIAAALASWLAVELDALEARPSTVGYRRHELLARELARALARAAGEASTPALERALARTLELAPESPGPVPAKRYRPLLPKACAGLLGVTPRGRTALASYLGAEVPRRVRVEAGLALVAADVDSAIRARALSGLLADFEACDTVLRLRILEQLTRLGELSSHSFLTSVAEGEPPRPLEQRIAAIDALLARGEVASLGGALERARDPEVVAALIEALGRAGAGAAPHLERALETRLSRRGTEDEREDDARMVVSLLTALVELDALGEHARRRFTEALARPMARAAAALAARFRSEPLAAPSFTWEAELRLARALAARGELLHALEVQGPWWNLDGELLSSDLRVVPGVHGKSVVKQNGVDVVCQR